MKEVNKKNLDELLRIERKYARTGDTDLLDKRNNLCDVLSEGTFGTDLKWGAFADLASITCGCNPLKNCTNNEVYAILALLGFEVTE